MKRSLPFLAALLLGGCAHVVRTHEEYAVPEEPLVNGAKLSAELLTTDGEVKYSLSAMVYFVAGEKETGPYKCLFSAWGKPGVHKSMTVHSLLVRASSGRRQAMPAQAGIPFAPSTKGDEVNATYVFPGLLTLDFAKDGEVFLDADVTVRSTQRSQRKKVSIRLSPAPRKDVRFHTIFDRANPG